MAENRPQRSEPETAPLVVTCEVCCEAPAEGVLVFDRRNRPERGPDSAELCRVCAFVWRKAFDRWWPGPAQRASVAIRGGELT